MDTAKTAKVKSFVGQFLLTGFAVLVALWGYDQLNKPKVAAPSTAPAATPPGAGGAAE
jgi:hypothetical protein